MKAPGFMEMMQILEIEHIGRHHSGIDDTRNIASMLCHMIQRDATISLNGGEAQHRRGKQRSIVNKAIDEVVETEFSALVDIGVNYGKKRFRVAQIRDIMHRAKIAGGMFRTITINVVLRHSQFYQTIPIPPPPYPSPL